MKSIFVSATFLSFFVSTAEAEIHRFTPTTYYNTFSFAHPPALRIAPGDSVMTRTIDAAGLGAELTRAAVGGIRKRAVLRGGRRAGRYPRREARSHRAEPRARFFARPHRALRRRPRSAPLARGGADHPPRPFGGNLDYAGMVAGVTVLLPVSEPGALLFIGDGHAAQGHGELVVTGVEVSMDVTFTVDLIKGKTIGRPRIENDDFLMVLGSARPLLQALQHATSALQSWLMSEYAYDERTSPLLMAKRSNTRLRTSSIPISPSQQKFERPSCDRIDVEME